MSKYKKTNLLNDQGEIIYELGYLTEEDVLEIEKEVA